VVVSKSFVDVTQNAIVAVGIDAQGGKYVLGLPERLGRIFSADSPQ